MGTPDFSLWTGRQTPGAVCVEPYGAPTFSTSTCKAMSRRCDSRSVASPPGACPRPTADTWLFWNGPQPATFGCGRTSKKNLEKPQGLNAEPCATPNNRPLRQDFEHI